MKNTKLNFKKSGKKTHSNKTNRKHKSLRGGLGKINADCKETEQLIVQLRNQLAETQKMINSRDEQLKNFDKQIADIKEKQTVVNDLRLELIKTKGNLSKLQMKIEESDIKLKNASEIEEQLKTCITYLTPENKDKYYEELRGNEDLYGANVPQS